MADLEIHMVPKNLYYQEADYVRGLANEIDRLRRVNAELLDVLRAVRANPRCTVGMTDLIDDAMRAQADATGDLRAALAKAEGREP